MSGIKSMNIDSSACVRIKGSESEQFRIESGVRQGCIMYPSLFNDYMEGVMREVKMRMGRRGVSFLEDRIEWILPGLFYADNVVVCSVSEEDLRVMVGWFAEVCRKR